MTFSAQQQVSTLLNGLGFEHFGITPLAPAVSLSFYKSWIDDGYHGEMDYLKRHLPKKENPEGLLPRAKSAIVIGFKYVPHPRPHDEDRTPGLRIAHYARGEDYHLWVKEKLEEVILDLKKIYPREDFLAATDSSPVLERDIAYRGGLGWFGKNTCLIHKSHGSLFLLGEILTTLTLELFVPNLHPDHCGTCTRCIDACPTQALIAPRKLDARKCISYLTIESKAIPPIELRGKMGDNFFGCDICQTVCPWNEKVFGAVVKKEQEEKLQVKNELIEDLRFILRSSNVELERHFAHSPLARARGFGLKRNALVVAANQKLSKLRAEISDLVSDPRLGELAQWALDHLQN